MEKEKTERRSFFNKLLSTAVLGGIVSLILGHKVEKVHGLDGSGAANRVTYWTDSDTIAGTDAFQWINSTRSFKAGSIGNSITSGVNAGTISGGGTQTFPNKVTDDHCTVGGGEGNQAGDAAGTTSDKTCATVSGGFLNTASNYLSTVSGGGTNTASGNSSTVGGGVINEVSGSYATVAGGTNNTASGNSSTVGGGVGNTAAGDYSFASGRRAKISSAHDGAFLFADSNDYDFNSAIWDEFAVRCTGGARFVTSIHSGSGMQDRGLAITPAGDLELFDWFWTGFSWTRSVPATIKKNGWLGIGTSGPVRAIHLKGGNACFRMDRDVDSSAFILVRTSPGFSSVWKTFYVGVDASGVNNGEFFIGDVGNNVSGASTKRLRIYDDGTVWAKKFSSGDYRFANDFIVTEDEKAGLAFKNDSGEKIAILDREGNLQVKGKITENPNL